MSATSTGMACSLTTIAEAAAHVAQAPAGLVSLVDEEWDHFAGVFGAPGSLAAGDRIPLVDSLCQHVVAGLRPVLITDADGDERARNSPGAARLGLRAYAGVPLCDGQTVVGVLCAVDVRARPWTAEQVAALNAVALTAGLIPGLVHPAPDDDGPPDVTSVIDALAEAFVAVDTTGRIRLWNTAASALFGWTAAEARGRFLHDLLLPAADLAERRQALSQLRDLLLERRDGQGAQRVLRVRTRDGGDVPVQVALSALPVPGGSWICGTMVDLSLRRDGRAPARTGGFLRTLLDSLTASVYACDAAGQTAFTNAALGGLLDLPVGVPTAAADLGRDHLVWPDGRPLVPAEHPSARALAGEQVRQAELGLAVPGRPRRTLIVNAERIVVDGVVLGAVVVLDEVTEQRRAQRFRECELAVSRALVDAAGTAEAAQAVLAAIADCWKWPHAELWLVDESADVLRPAATWTAEPGRGDPLVVPALSPGQGLAGTTWSTGAPVWVADLTAGHCFEYETLPWPGLRTALAVPVRSGSDVLGVLALYADTLDEDQELLTSHLCSVAAYVGEYLQRRRAEEVALELARTKDDFLALVGHELRTPLTSITTYTQLLADLPEQLPPEIRPMIEVIGRNSDSLTAIIDDLLDLAGLESGKITLRPADIDLAGLVRDAAVSVRAAADRRRVTLILDVPDRVPLHGDPQRLRQMLDNLLSNGVKYNRDGGTLTIRLATDCAGTVLTVSDTGIGIPEAERDQLFQRFFRSSIARASGAPGTGLGLVVTRTIVECHGGQIAASDNKPGTTMTVRLPSAAPSAAARTGPGGEG
ncbi:ATP-binding protein [Cryptosporangium aurantiacum]|nr:ATP-binding protein [Cryptosporangium aurantiacum]